MEEEGTLYPTAWAEDLESGEITVQEHPKEWLERKAEDYIWDNYSIEVKRDGDRFFFKIHSIYPEGGKAGIGFRIGNDISYDVTAKHIEACFRALFRHAIIKKENFERADAEGS